QPDADGYGDKRAEQRVAEPTRDVEGGVESVPEEIADPDESGGPNHRRDEIQAQKPVPANRAEPEREGREIANAVDKAERENEPDIVPFQPGESALNPGAPTRKTREKPHAVFAA